MKNENLYQEIQAAKRKEKIATAKKRKILLEKAKELRKAINPIEEKYETMLSQLEKERDEYNDKVWYLASIYHDYASFYTGDITNLFALFLSYIEGEKFIHYRNWENCEINENSMIIKEKVNQQYDKIDYNTLNNLYENNDLILLNKGCSNRVDFYDNVGEPNYYFGKYNYLKEFINKLIQYRINNDIKSPRAINDEILFSFMCDFIVGHPDLASRNENKRKQMLIGNTKDKDVIEIEDFVKKLTK